jgi:hypothetical protein
VLVVVGMMMMDGKDGTCCRGERVMKRPVKAHGKWVEGVSVGGDVGFVEGIESRSRRARRRGEGRAMGGRALLRIVQGGLISVRPN